MALTGKLVGSVEIKSGGKVLHDLLKHKSHEFPSVSPGKIHACNHLSGQKGSLSVGSTIQWEFTHDGTKQTATEIIEEIDVANHKIVFKVIAGDLIEKVYKAFKITFHCEHKDGKQWGIWTMEFEKPNANVPDPNAFMDYLCDILKDMDNHGSRK